jgi:hypothetical protein
VRWAHEEIKENAAERSGEPESALEHNDETESQ